MTKLSNKRVSFIVKTVSKGKAKCSELARLYEVSSRMVRQLVATYKKTGQVPILSKQRRPKTFLTEEQKRLIEQAYNKRFLGATLLRLDIQKKFEVNIPHNKIHAYLKEKGLAEPDEKKQKQCKYCRYERDHSFSLGHLDWYETDDRTKVLPILDDTSRKIL